MVPIALAGRILKEHASEPASKNIDTINESVLFCISPFSESLMFLGLNILFGTILCTDCVAVFLTKNGEREFFDSGLWLY